VFENREQVSGIWTQIRGSYRILEKLNPLKSREREKEQNFVRRFPGYARSSFW
jgi:hypothetical protein